MESMLFVFGKRAKRMRLNKLNELIHNSSLQDNLRFARVTIFFKEIKDLDDEKFEEVPNSNFVLSREVYKNGSSKYFLNNREIHFDSLCTILDKKGIDLKHNRFLILQGEVEQISMMKPRAANPGEIGLLEFLEDIIGTTRYVNLIEKLGKDIDELGEIKTQKSNRVRMTKNELDQLEDVKNASTEYYKKEKELHIFGHLDYLLKRHLVNKQILDHQDKIEKNNINLGEIDKKISSKVEENSFIIEQHKKIKKEQEVLKQKRIELNKQTDALDEIDKVKRADIDNYSKNISKAKNALEKLNKNYQNQSENIQNARTELPKKEKEIVELRESKKRNEDYIIEREQEVFDKTEKFQIRKREIEKQIQPYEDKINANTFQIEQNNSTINLISQKFDKINNELKATETRKSECEKILKEKSEFISQVEVSIKNLENTLKDSRENLIKANAELDNRYKNTQSLLAKISEIKSSNQERHQKNNILDSLLKAQQEGKLSGIYGRLGDLGVIDAKYDIAITTACSNLDSIVVETVDHAQKCLDFLKKYNIGRATFLILEKIAWVDNNMKNAFRTPNHCERLFDLVKYKNQKLNHAFYFALRDTLVAPDLKIASNVAYGSTRHRVVTLNGELIEVSGTMSGGGKPKRGGMSNKELSEEYSQEYINRLNSEYENLVKEFEMAKMERNQMENRCNTINSQLQESLIIKNKTQNECLNIEKVLAETQKNFINYKKEFEKYQKDIHKVEEMKKNNIELNEKNQALTAESSELRRGLNEIESEIGKIGGEEFTKKKEEIKMMKKRIDVLDKEINSMRHLVDNSTEILDKIKDEIILKEKVIKDFEDQIDKIKTELEEIENQGLELFGEIDVCQRDITNLEKQFLEKSKEVEDLKIAVRRMRDEQDKLRTEINEINMEIKKCEKNEKNISDDLKKNKSSFKKLIDEFGFIDEFEKEIRGLGRGPKIVNDGMLIDEDNPLNIQDEKMDVDDGDYENSHKNKIKKGPSNYRKYIDSKYMEYNFKMEELEELSTSNVR